MIQTKRHRSAARCLLAGALFACAPAFGASAEPGEKAPVLNHSAEEAGVRPWQIVGASVYLLVLGGVGLGIVYYVRRGFLIRDLGPARGQEIKVACVTKVSPTTSVALIDVEGRRVLVASGSSGTALLELSKNA